MAGRHTHFPLGPPHPQLVNASPCFLILSQGTHTQKMVEEEEKWESLELRGREAEKKGKEDGFLIPGVSVERGDCASAATVEAQ